MFARNYETQGVHLIRLKWPAGVVNATSENFSIAALNLAGKTAFQENFKPESGVICLVLDELNVFTL
ncbi:MAG: hypothetical protein V3U84_10730 [Thiotrichaceae bacterium]